MSKLLSRFIPYLGIAKLIADLIAAAVLLFLAIKTYLDAVAPPQVPYALLTQPDTSDRLPVEVGVGTKVSLLLSMDHQPQSTLSVPFKESSGYSPVLAFGSSSLNFTASNYRNLVQEIAIQQMNQSGVTSFSLGSYCPDITLKLVEDTISINANEINLDYDGTNQQVWAAKFPVVWEGFMNSNETVNITYQLQDQSGNPLEATFSPASYAITGPGGGTPALSKLGFTNMICLIVSLTFCY